MRNRFQIVINSSESATTYNVVDSEAPEREQPAVMIGFTTAKDHNAQFLAEDYCYRHNAKESD